METEAVLRPDNHAPAKTRCLILMQQHVNSSNPRSIFGGYQLSYPSLPSQLCTLHLSVYRHRADDLLECSGLRLPVAYTRTV